MEFEDLVGLEEEDLLEHVFNERSKGFSSGEIFERLMSRGLTEDEALSAMFNAEEKAKKKIEEANQGILLGVFFLLAGVGIQLVTKSSSNVTVIDIISYCLIVYAVIRIVNSWFKFSVYGKWKNKKSK